MLSPGEEENPFTATTLVLPRRFDRARPFLVLGLFFLVWLIVPTVIKRFMRISFFEFQAPIDTTASAIRDVQEFWSLRTRPQELIEAGRELARLNAKYETSLQEMATLRADVKRYEQLLRLPSFSEYRSEPARVARRDFNAWWQRLVIRKGRDYRIPLGAPVIFVGGVVGRVTDVGAYTSVVELISSPGVRIAGSLEEDPRAMSFQGGINPSLGPAKGLVEFVPLDVLATPTTPKRLITSGLGGIFPRGLAIGDITKVDSSSDGLFKTGEVRLDPRLASVTEVTVLVPLKAE